MPQLTFAKWFQAGLNEQLGVGNFFESVIEEVYTLVLRPGDFVIDGGASRGRHTLPLYRSVGHRGLVLAVEAITPLCHALIDRSRAEGLSGVLVFNQVLARQAGRSLFGHVQELDGWSGIVQRQDLPTWAVGSIQWLDLPAITLDQLIAEQRLPSVRFVKLDLSGGEHQALCGGRAMLKSPTAPLIVFEHGRQASADLYGYGADEWFRLFAESGYQVFDLFGRPFDRAAWDSDGVPWYCIAAKRAEDLRFVRDDLPGVVAGTHRRLLPGAA
jgi:FkbM family methyltransferase